MTKKKSKKKLKKKFLYRRLALILISVLVIVLLVKGCSDSKKTEGNKETTENTQVANSSNSTDQSNTASSADENADGQENKDENTSGSSADQNTDTSANNEETSMNIDENAENTENTTTSKKTNGENYLENSKKEGVTENDEGELIVDDAAALDVICNKVRKLPSDYAPTDLVKITDFPTVLENPEVNQIRKVAYDSLVELVAACKEETGIQLYGRSGYRSYNTQVALYNGYVANHGKEAADKFSARPGASEHQTGLAIDVTSKNMNYQLDTNFIDFEEGKWLADNAYKYGFIIRFPEGQESITGYIYEPWHIRYLGKELAKEVFDSELTFEEYMFGDKIDE